MSWTPLLRFTLGQADINDNRNFLQCENDNDADQMRHTYCINNMKQNTLTWVILHTANHPQCKHNRAVSLKWNPHSPAGLLVVCLAGGRLRLPRWFFSCSTALAPAGLMIQARHDRWEGFETLAQTAHVPTDTEPHPSHYDTTHTCVFHVWTQTQSLLAQTHFYTLLHALPYSKKASTDLKQCLNVRDGIERHKEKRKSMQKVRTVTPGSRRKDVRWFLPLSTESITSCRRQLTALSTLECGPFVRFQT